MKSVFAALAVVLGCAHAAQAEVVVLDFEGIDHLASVSEFYNGGTDGAGNSGVDYGISFQPYAVVAEHGTFGVENPPSGTMVMGFGTESTYLNSQDGFTSAFSFFYSTFTNEGYVTVFDGLDATGNVLASIDLDPVGVSATGAGLWEFESLNFFGTARSVLFAGTASATGFDNISLNLVEPASAVPAPATIALFALGLAGLGVSRKRNNAM